ncbi:ATP-grasp domain-containing protein [Sulfuriflexus mobilis]|uniref:ATP-grasp domain-containing protein n=1 Tax=Sulfuriflexus mobilis TaxID=1811807 RepID=UPI000F834084|nr:ATP-grasp domain-containing protein [Sulfuriflexus mobilis]
MSQSQNISSLARRLLLLAPHNSYRIAPYLQAAAELGVEVTIASAGKHSLVSAISEGLHIDFNDPDAAIALLHSVHLATPFDAVMGSDDHSVELASQVAEALGLPHNPPGAAAIARRKDKARACLQSAGVRVPAHFQLDLHHSLAGQINAVRYPCVLKPLAMSASRGVIRVDDEEGLLKAAARIETLLRDTKDEEEGRYVLVEDYIEGLEVAYEGMLDKGLLQQLALFDKPDALQGPYFEETYYITPSRHEIALQQAAHETVAAACQAYGLQQGPVHAELRMDAEGKLWVMEVAARTIGGECARLVELATGQRLETLVIAQALGQVIPQKEFSGGAGVLMIPIPKAGILRRVEGTLAAQAVEGIEELVISVREGHELVPVPDGASYLGFIYAVAEDAPQAEQALRAAHAKLTIVTAPLFGIEDRRDARS